MSKQIKNIEEKKEEFRNYLEKYGVVDAMTQALVSLYEETNKPENPLDYIRKRLSPQQDVDEDSLKVVNEELKKQIVSLQSIINEQNNELERYKN